MEIFRKASGGLRRGAPGQRFLGSVGSMRVSVMEENKKPSYEVHYIQAHAKSGTKRSPPRALLTKYGGWRQKLLEVVFNEAKKNGGLVHITTKNPDLNPVEALKLQTRLDIFKEVAKKCGFTVRAEYLGNEEKFISLVASLKK